MCTKSYNVYYDVYNGTHYKVVHIIKLIMCTKSYNVYYGVAYKVCKFYFIMCIMYYYKVVHIIKLTHLISHPIVHIIRLSTHYKVGTHYKVVHIIKLSTHYKTLYTFE